MKMKVTLKTEIPMELKTGGSSNFIRSLRSDSSGTSLSFLALVLTIIGLLLLLARW